MKSFQFDFANALAKLKADSPTASADLIVETAITEPKATASAQAIVAKPSQSANSMLHHLANIESYKAARESLANQSRTAERSEALPTPNSQKAEQGTAEQGASEQLAKPNAKPMKPFQFSFANKLAVATPDSPTDKPSTGASMAAEQGIPSSEPFQWDESQLRAIDSIMNNQFSVLIGAAGSGKTTVVKEIVARLKASGIIHELEYQRMNGSTRKSYNISFCSFTGKAVEQLRKSIPPELQCCCETIHSLLEYAPTIVERIVEDKSGNREIKQSKIFVPRRDEYSKLVQNVIIIDESGMVGIELWNNLWKALEKTSETKVILIGDIHQLPAVIGKSILGYALASPRWTTCMLTKIHRQAMDNPIIRDSHLIKDGLMPVASEPRQDTNGQPLLRQVSLVNIGSLTETERQAVRNGSLPKSYYDQKNKASSALGNFVKFVAKLYKAGHYDPAIDQIIVPQNVGLLGQDIINQKLAPIFNSENRRHAVRASYETKFLAVGDKVMFTKNDYELGILNGMTGYIKSINLNPSYADYRLMQIAEDQAANGVTHDLMQPDDSSMDYAEQAFNDLDKLMEQKSDDSDKLAAELEASHIITVEYTPLGSSTKAEVPISKVGQVRGLLLAYAITCHKAQGSEYRRVIMVAHSSNSQMLSREWLYTAATRARENLIIVYNDYQSRGLASGLKRQVVKGETLAEKAKNFSLAEATSESTKLQQTLIPLGIFTDKEMDSLKAGMALAGEPEDIDND